jgi:uncharacterized membrane protein SpoIIM required for sporulation
MKESDFIKQNKIKWIEVEKNLTNADVKPSDTSKLFVQVTDDLSYARTFYKNRSVKIYLNEIAKFLFNDINKAKNNYFKSFLNFWKTDLPMVLYVSRRSLLISFIVFVCCFTLGVITSIYDPHFCKAILSSNYIDMTNENIAKGDAMAVYKSDSEMETFLPILLNNMRIDFITFFSGIFMAVGSLLIMVVNGVMVGVFQYFFIEKGLFWESFLAIWTHGTLEISAIILSGGAGLTLGKGLLFPGTYSRLQALRISGMNGLKIIMGVIPLTLVAAFIEGFLTRHTDIPDPIRFTFILISFAFVIIYFFWYPRRVAKKYPQLEKSVEINPVYKQEKEFNPNEVLTPDRIMAQTLRLFLKNLKFFGGHILVFTVVLIALVCSDSFNLLYNNENLNFAPADYFNYDNYPLLGLISCISFLFMQFRLLLFLRSDLNKNGSSSKKNAFYSILLLTLILSGFLMIADGGYQMFAFLLFPVLSLISNISAHQDVSFLKAMNLTGGLLNKQWGTFVIGSLFSFCIGWALFVVLAFGSKFLLLEDSILWALTDNESTANTIRIGISVFQISAGFLFYMTLNSIFNSIFFYTLKEINTAENLISRIHQIKANK